MSDTVDVVVTRSSVRVAMGAIMNIELEQSWEVPEAFDFGTPQELDQLFALLKQGAAPGAGDAIALGLPRRLAQVLRETPRAVLALVEDWELSSRTGSVRAEIESGQVELDDVLGAALASSD